MQADVKTYLKEGSAWLRRWAERLGGHRRLQEGACLLLGFLLSAGALEHRPLPFALGLCCALTGSRGVLAALGGCLGAWVFWGASARPEAVGCLLAMAFVLVLGMTRLPRKNGWLMPLVAGLCTALAGLLGQERGFLLYSLHILLAIGSARMFAMVREQKQWVAGWLGWGVLVLCISQIVVLGMSLGIPVAAALTVAGTLPQAALAGLALELSGVTAVPMTAVLSLAWLAHLLPRRRSAVQALAPMCAGSLIMGLTASVEISLLPGLLLGGLCGLAVPGSGGYVRRRGEVGIAQVRLELASGVLTRMRQLLSAQTPPPVDEQALLTAACRRACGSCSCHKGCAGEERVAQLPLSALREPIAVSFPFSCRKPGRIQGELRRAQEQLRRLVAARRQREESRQAVLQQYGFLSLYLRELSDGLQDRTPPRRRYRPEVAFCGNRPEAENGDRCLSFPGTENRHYVLLCDGMGTGDGAVQEGRQAGQLLKELLMAGFPAEHALASLNSLYALGDRAGAATVDLAELQLDSGRVSLYKWGAAPSWLLDSRGKEKIGTVSAVPGLSLAEGRETVHKLSLKKGELLILLSDGVSGEEALPGAASAASAPLADTAARILEGGALGGDDATVALIRLSAPDLRLSYHE